MNPKPIFQQPGAEWYRVFLCGFLKLQVNFIRLIYNTL